MLVLASASDRRKELLSKAGFEFEIMPADVDESAVKERDGARLSLRLARLKAKVSAEKLIEERRESFVVLGADTVVEHGGKIYGKPKDEKDATAMLRQLCGGSHSVYTSVCLISSEGTFSERTVKTRVTFGEFDEPEIAAYIKSGKAFGKAGAYGIQDEELGFLIKKINGDRDNVIGLPTFAVVEMLKEKSKWRQWK